MNALDTVKLIAADLVSGLTDDQINDYIAIAVAQLDPCVWGGLYTLGVANLTAHLISTYTVRAASAGGGAAGPVTMEIAGRVTIQYAKPTDWEKNSLRLTPWGLELERLGKKLPGTKMFNTGFRNVDMCNPNPSILGENNEW